MADEPNASIARVSDAHDENGGQREPSCISSVGPSNDATLPGNRKVMEAHDADLFMAARGLEPSQSTAFGWPRWPPLPTRHNVLHHVRAERAARMGGFQ